MKLDVLAGAVGRRADLHENGEDLLRESVCDVSGQVRHLLDAAPRGADRGPWPQKDILWFGLPIFEHIESHRRTGQATMEPRGRRAVHEHLQHAITELLEDEVRMALRRSSRAARHASPDLLVRWIASTFVLVLNWWVESDSPLPAREADDLFRALIEPSLAAWMR